MSLRVRAGDIAITLEPLFPDQELDARAGVGTVYWEGAVRAMIDGRIAGRGYLELTGYGEPLKLGSDTGSDTTFERQRFASTLSVRERRV